MKQMPLLMIPNNPEAQHNYEQLKTENIFTWQYDEVAMINIHQGNFLTVINEITREIMLIKFLSTLSSSQGNHSDSTIVRDKILQGDYSTCQFFDAEIIELQLLPKTLKASSGLNPSKGKQIYFLNKPHHQTRRNLILSTVRPESEIYKFLSDPEEITECIAFKENNRWGFLYYTKTLEAGINFRFEPVVNFRDGKKLNPTDKGYRDFTYFIRAEALPKAYKIGRAEDPDKRMAQLRGQNHREITRMLLIPDGRMETVFHSRYNQFLIEGKKEWFEIADSLTAYIKNEKAKVDRIAKFYKDFQAVKFNPVFNLEEDLKEE